MCMVSRSMDQVRLAFTAMDAEALHRAIGCRVRELRCQQGTLSQEALAARAGFHRTFVGKVDRGETAVTVDNIAGLCSALEVTLAQFFEPFDQQQRIKGPRRNRT